MTRPARIGANCRLIRNGQDAAGREKAIPACCADLVPIGAIALFYRRALRNVLAPPPALLVSSSISSQRQATNRSNDLISRIGPGKGIWQFVVLRQMLKIVAARSPAECAGEPPVLAARGHEPDSARQRYCRWTDVRPRFVKGRDIDAR